MNVIFWAVAVVAFVILELATVGLASIWFALGALMQDHQEAAPVDFRTPSIGDITVRNVTCTGVDACFLCAYGLPESPIGSITVQDVSVSYLPHEKRTPQCPIMMDGFPKLSGRSIVLKNVKSVSLERLTITGAADDAPEVTNTENISVDAVYTA